MIRQNNTNPVTVNKKVIYGLSRNPNFIDRQENIALQLYYISRAEKIKKQPRLPKNDLRRHVVQSNQNISLLKKLQLKITIDATAIKKMLTTAFSSLQFKLNKI
jgi:hypothetical protein